MSDAERQGTRYRFAGFELEPRERRLLAHGEPVTLTPKVFDTLVLLVEHAAHTVSRDELSPALWPRGFVNDHIHARHIRAIGAILARRALSSASAANLDLDTVRATRASAAAKGARR